MRFSVEEMEAAYAEIHQKANPKLAFVGAIVGVTPAMTCYFLLAAMGGLLYIMLIVPPLVVGWFARFVGRTFRHRDRLSVGVVGALVHVGGCLLLELNPVIFVLTPVAFGIAMASAKVKLDRVHIWALEMAEQGKINTGQQR